MERWRVSILFALISLFPWQGFASDQGRFALVIGNAAYVSVPALKNPVNDADDISKGLTEIGWQVTKVTDATKLGLTRAIKKFRDQVAGVKNATVLFYYSGHGVQYRDNNYLIPIKFDEIPQDEEELASQSYSVKELTEALTEAAPKTTIVILDACRDNPFVAAKSRAVGAGTRGLAVVDLPSTESQSAIIFSTAPGTTASDGSGRNGVFTTAFLGHLKDNAQLTDMMNQVTADVQKATKGAQKPFTTYNMTASFYLLSDAEREARALAERQGAEAQRQAELTQAAEAARLAEAEKTKKAMAEAEAARQQVVAAQAALAAAQSQTAAARAGALSVTANLSGAVVSLVGEDETFELPHIFEGLPEGQYKVKISGVSSGNLIYSGTELSAAVVAGRRTKIDHSFVPGQGKLTVTDIPPGGSLIMDNWNYLPLEPQSDGKLFFAGDVWAGYRELKVELGQASWSAFTTLGIGRSLTVSVTSMQKRMIIETTKVQFAGKEGDFEGIAAAFEGAKTLTKTPVFSGSQISGGTVARDTDSFYLRFDVLGGKPTIDSRVVYALVLRQAGLELHVGIGPKRAGGAADLELWDEAHKKSTMVTSAVIRTGPTFVEAKFPLSYLKKSWLNPDGFDFDKPIKAYMFFSNADSIDANQTPSVDLLFQD